MSKKKTIVEMYEEIKKVPGLSAEQIAFLDKRIEITQKKNAKSANGERKPTKLQLENENIKADILAGMEPNRLYTITELIKEVPCCAELTNQKVSALLRQMKEAHLVERIEDKRKTYFRKVM